MRKALPDIRDEAKSDAWSVKTANSWISAKASATSKDTHASS